MVKLGGCKRRPINMVSLTYLLVECCTVAEFSVGGNFAVGEFSVVEFAVCGDFYVGEYSVDEFTVVSFVPLATFLEFIIT